ncbi:MAG: hypothetical protein LBQ63_04550 [Deltaproteobacteria bacterium]|jgi:hypothetical protein|nr:hypothetical protein [Deltaproteobacteria bacterium]
MNKPKLSGKSRWIIPGLVLLLAALFFVGKNVFESRAALRIKDDLALSEPYLILENAEVEVSLLSRSVVIRDIVYSVPDYPELGLRIGSLTEKGIDLSTFLGRPGELSEISALILEKLEISLKGMEKPVLELEYYELNDLAYNYRDMRASLLKNKGVRDARARLADTLPYIRNAKPGRDSFRNIKINLQQKGLFDFSLASGSSSGKITLNPESNSGFDTGVDDIRLSNLSLFSEGFAGDFNLNLSLEDFHMQGYKSHYSKLMDLLIAHSASPEPDPENFFLSLLPVLLDYYYERSESKNLRVSADLTDMGGISLAFSVDSIETGAHSISELGMERLRNLRFEKDRKEILSLEEAGSDRTVIPKALTDLILNPKNIMEDEQTQKLLSGDPYALLKGLRLENIYLKNLRLPDIASLGLWRTDIDLGDKANLKSLVRDLFLSQQILLQGFDFLEPYGEDEKREALQTLTETGNGLNLNSDFNLDMLAARLLEFTLTFSLEETYLGELKFAMDVLSGPPSPYETYGDPLLRKLEVSFADKGFRDAFLRYLVKSGEYGSIAEARDGILAEFDQTDELAGKNSLFRSLLPALRSFVNEGGSIRLALNPENPVPMDDLDKILLENANLVNVTVQHSK